MTLVQGQDDSEDLNEFSPRSSHSIPNPLHHVHKQRNSGQSFRDLDGQDENGGVKVNQSLLGRCCFRMRLRVEREDGSLLIGGFTLANNCQAIMVIFGFFFTFAGTVLTIISYKTPHLQGSQSEESSTRDEGKVGGPVFIVVGSLLFLVGLFLSWINWKLHREAKRQRNRFSLPSVASPEDGRTQYQWYRQGPFGATLPSPQGGQPSSSYPSTRKSSENPFTSNYFVGRRRTLPTISQAVPLGFLIDGRVSEPGVNDQEKGVGSAPAHPGGHRDSSACSRRKASLSLRASLPIPLLGGSPNFMRVRSNTPVEPVNGLSDEPFGSIVSLAGTGDIACFPAHGPRFPPLRSNTPHPRLPFFDTREGKDWKVEGQEGNNLERGNLPVIRVDDCVDPLTKSHKRNPSLTMTTPLPNFNRKKDDGLDEQLIGDS